MKKSKWFILGGSERVWKEEKRDDDHRQVGRAIRSDFDIWSRHRGCIVLGVVGGGNGAGDIADIQMDTSRVEL
jgi:membrane glycosyltransferase